MGKRKRVYLFEPVLFDQLSGSKSMPEPGARVVKTQPFGCPKNGTMRMCYVACADTGRFYQLVCLGSLKQTGETVEVTA